MSERQVAEIDDADRLEANKAVVRRFFDAMGANGPAPTEAAFAGLFAESARFWSLHDRNWLEGRAAIMAMMENVAALYPRGMRFATSNITAEADRVCVIAECDEMLESGRRYQNCFHFFFRISGDQITELREYADTHHIFLTFGT